MKVIDYDKFRKDVIAETFTVSDSKGEDYRRGDDDALYNFKSLAERLDMNPLDILMIYKIKHQDAINNFVKSRGQSESEPIRNRVIDDINYNLLLLALIDDMGLNE
jgi:hypothetical protein